MADAKKAKVDKDPAALQQEIERLQEVQSEAETLDEKKNREIVEVERKYFKLLAPIFERRKKIIAQIPDFWLTVLKNHPVTSSVISERDQDALRFLDDLSVEIEDTKEGDAYKIIFRFNDNPYFSNKELTKEFRTSDEGATTSKATKIEWKAGKDLTKPVPQSGKDKKRLHDEMDSLSFFQLFTEEDEGVELGEYLRSEVYINPLKLYLGIEDDDDEEDFGEFEEGASGDEEAEEEDD